MKQNKRLFFTFTALLALSSATALAAPAPVRSSAEPSRAAKQIAPLEAPHQAEGSAIVSSKAALQAPQGAEGVKFTLSDVTVEGLTAYSESQVKSLWKDMIGKTISLADVYDIANKLTAKYRNDGYILTQVVVPPQTIAGGHVKFRVVEGFANDVRLEGETNGRLSDLQPYVDKIRAAHPFSSKVLERNLLLINDLPGISAKAVLSPSKVAGATDVVIVVSRKPYDVFLQADNRGTRYLGPLQLNAGVRFNNPFGTYEGINLQYATAPIDGELNYGAVSVTEPLGHEGTKLTAGASITRTLPGFTLTPFNVKGVSRNINFEVAHPFIRSRNENLSTTLRFDYLDSDRSDNVTGFPIEDVLSVARLGATYQLVDRFAGANAVSAELSKGLSIFGSTGGGHPNTTRPGADDRFFKGTAEISRIQRLTGHFDLFVSGTGQWAAQRLLTSEQFGLGGAAYGSAYDPSEITGDDGVAARTELRMNDIAPFMPVKSTQFYGFYDIGKVWDPGNTIASDRQASLASAGGGLRLSINDSVSGSFELAAPLTRNVATENARRARLFGSLTAKF